MQEFFTEFSENILESLIAYGPRIIGGLFILVIGWFLAGWSVRASSRLFQRTDALDQTLEKYISKLLRFAVLAITFIAALSSFGVQTASIIAVFGAMGIAVGLALQGTLSNVASGIVILLLRPFRVDDVVDIAGTIGVVQTVGVFATELKTGEGLFVMIPNSKIWGNNITNMTRNGTRRVDMVFSISYSDDMDRAVAIIEEIIAEDKRVLGEPAPFIKVGELNADSVDIYARPWTLNADFFAVKLDVTKKVKERFDAEGISIPFVQREIRIVRESEAA